MLPASWFWLALEPEFPHGKRMLSEDQHQVKRRFIGIEIGGTKLQLVVGDERACIETRRRLAVDAAQGAEGIRRQITAVFAELALAEAVEAVGVGFGGPVDWRSGKICRSHQIEGWSEFDLAGWLRQLSGAPVVVDNDANVGALGEAKHGAGVGFNPVFYVTLGSGVGGGLVVDGRIFHGTTPGESEIGHIRMDRQGTIVEARCSGWAIDARIRELNEADPRSALSRLAAAAPGAEARHLAAALVEDDPHAKRLVHELCEDLGFALSHAVQLVHPDMVVLGGGLAGIGEPLRGGVAAALKRYTMRAFAPGPEVRLAVLGADAVPVGALVLAREFRH